MKTMARKFTLIELLTVVCVIAILMALLLPAIGRARKSGGQATCANNFRQIGLTFRMYSDDNLGWCIPATTSEPLDGGPWAAITWDDLLSRYDGRALPLSQMQLYGIPASDTNKVNKTYNCPLDSTAPGSLNPRSIAINLELSGVWSGGNWGPGACRIDSISAPSATVSFVERYYEGDGTRNALGNWAGSYFHNDDGPMNPNWVFGIQTSNDDLSTPVSNHPNPQNLPWLHVDGHVDIQSRLYKVSNYSR